MSPRIGRRAAITALAALLMGGGVASATEGPAPMPGGTPTADISATWCVNPKRVHATGHSSGAIMAERLACDEWLARNSCPLIPATELGVPLEASTYRPCRADVEILWRVYLLQGHNWPTGADNADIRTRMRALFERNPLP